MCRIGLVLLVGPWVSGCGREFAAPPVRRAPAEAAAQAIATYDADADGALDERELRSSPALLAARTRLDSNKDGKLAAAEIASRLEAYRGRSDFIATVIHVTRKAKPVAGLRVSLKPEPFLGADYPIYAGVTDEHGAVLVAPPGGGMQGIVPVGFYTLEITGSGSATRGCEFADDVPAANRLEVAL